MTGFIVLEGGEGGGKSTQTPILAEWLATFTGVECRTTRDPGDTDLGQQMRNLIMDEQALPNLRPIEQLTLFGVAKMALARERVIPARNDGVWLISDRFQFGSPIYQGFRSDNSEFEWLVRHYTENLLNDYWPDLTLVLDVPPEIGLSRKEKSGEKLNFFDRESLAFHKKIRSGYLYYAKLYANRGTVVIDATQPLEAVTADLKRAISSHFALAA